VVENNKYTLSDKQLKQLLLVSNVQRGVKWTNNDIEESEHEAITSFRRETSQKKC